MSVDRTTSSACSRSTSMCEVCRVQEYKYTCPRCAIHTCSLLCVNKHKEETSCNGQRDKTAFIPLEEYTESHLISDFKFLEEINEKVQLAKKERMNWIKLKELGQKAKNRKQRFKGGWRKRYGRGRYRGRSRGGGGGGGGHKETK